jgi:D-3-phosphoglycerate dehydrogenase
MMATAKINILGQYLATNEYTGYVVLDIDKKISSHALKVLKEVKETLRVRLLY